MIIRYVSHKDIKKYERAGWVVKNHLTGTYAGQFSVLMVKLTDEKEFQLWDDEECRTKKLIGSTAPLITRREAALSALITYATAWVQKASPTTVRERLKNIFTGGGTKVVSKTSKKQSITSTK